jgi:hypothetical protein
MVDAFVGNVVIHFQLKLVKDVARIRGWQGMRKCWREHTDVHHNGEDLDETFIREVFA